MSSRQPRPQPYKLVIIGLGRVALKHLKAVRHNAADFSVCALVEPNAAAAAKVWQQAKMKGELPPVYASLNDCLAAQAPEVAAICTPSGSHYNLAKVCLEQGLHCLIEKPITLDLSEAKELIDLAREKQLKIALGYIYRFFPLVHELARELAEGRYGRISSGSVQVFWGHDQAYYDAAAWRGTWAHDGGALMNQCVHALDLMCWLMQAPVSKAQGYITRQNHRMEAEDFGLANFELANGAALQLTGTTNSLPARPRAEFSLLCERAELHCGLHKKKPYFKLYNERGKRVIGAQLRLLIQELRHNPPLRRLRELPNPHSGIYRDFAEAIRHGRASRADGRAGFDSLAAILSVYASAKADGQTTACPPEGFKLEAMNGFFDRQDEPSGDALP